MIIQSQIFRKFDNIGFGINTRFAPGAGSPYYFNMSHSVGQKKNAVEKNRTAFFKSLGLDSASVAFQQQIHSDIVTYVDRPGNCGESDAMITDRPGLALAASVADCVPVFVYDRSHSVIAAIHSGWRGTAAGIVLKTLDKMSNDFGSSPEGMYAYIGPSVSQQNYEVGGEVAEKFDCKYSRGSGNGKFHLNVSGACYDMLLGFGIPEKNIQLSSLCTFGLSGLLHSYRRDGEASGRHLGVIFMKGGK